jgi:hypothetical protein
MNSYQRAKSCPSAFANTLGSQAVGSSRNIRGLRRENAVVARHSSAALGIAKHE